MPKKEYRILGFHGGLNDHSDAKDIRDIDLKSATGVSVHRIGRLVGIGNNTNTAVNSSEFTADIEPGYGLHYFSTDVNNAETKTSEDWLAIYDKANTKVRLYYRDKVNNDASPGFSSEEITFLGNIKANYYYADGMLRIGDAGHNERSKWFGYIDNDLFWTNQHGTTNLHDINKWSSGDQRLLPVTNLIGDDYFNLVDLSSANPDATTIGNGTQKKLILGYWTTEGGEWSGNYSFGCTFIYEGDQESALSVIYDDALNEIETTANFYEEQVMFQVFIPMGTSSTITTDASHRLGDDRIIGLNWYFKQQGEDEDWIFLMHTDLKEGGKHHWKAYNATAETSYGYWDGEVVNDGVKDSVTEGVDILLNSSTPNTHIAFWDNSNGTFDVTTTSAPTQYNNWLAFTNTGSVVPSYTGQYDVGVWIKQEVAAIWNQVAVAWNAYNETWDTAGDSLPVTLLYSDRAWISGSNESSITTYVSADENGTYTTYNG